MTLLSTFLLSFVIVLGAFAAMAIGRLLGRSDIRGSCGGIGNGGCELCRDDRKSSHTLVGSGQEQRL